MKTYIVLLTVNAFFYLASCDDESLCYKNTDDQEIKDISRKCQNGSEKPDEEYPFCILKFAGVMDDNYQLSTDKLDEYTEKFIKDDKQEEAKQIGRDCIETQVTLSSEEPKKKVMDFLKCTSDRMRKLCYPNEG